MSGGSVALEKQSESCVMWSLSCANDEVIEYLCDGTHLVVVPTQIGEGCKNAPPLHDHRTVRGKPPAWTCLHVTRTGLALSLVCFLC